MITLTLAGSDLVGQVTGYAPYPGGGFHHVGAARLNSAVFQATGGKIPCFAIPAKQGGFRWIAVGTSREIARALATRWLARYGADLDHLEAVSDASHTPIMQKESRR